MPSEKKPEKKQVLVEGFRRRLVARVGVRGAAMVEYALLLFLVAPVVAGITQVGYNLHTTYQRVQTEILKSTP